MLPELSRSADPGQSLEVFRRMCRSRYFELGALRAAEARQLNSNVYLSLGQESIAAALSLTLAEFIIFAQHRCHATYLAFGGDPAKLRDELVGLPSGSSGGRGGSNCLQCHENGVAMYGHHGLIGENVPLGVGMALGSGKPVVCFFGDGAAEEDYVLAAMGFAATHKLPVLFVCEDNDLSILTNVSVRRSWSVVRVAEALGMPAIDIADDPWTALFRAAALKQDLPAFMNIRTCRANWHVGTGVDGPPEWDRFALVKAAFARNGLVEKANVLEAAEKAAMEQIWDNELLRTLSGK